MKILLTGITSRPTGMIKKKYSNSACTYNNPLLKKNIVTVTFNDVELDTS